MIEVLAPGILFIGAAWLLLPWLHPEDGRARAAMVAVMIALMWRYMLWRWFATLPSVGLTFDFAVGVVFVELAVISWIRERFMDTSLASAVFQVGIGGLLVFLTGILIGSS